MMVLPKQHRYPATTRLLVVKNFLLALLILLGYIPQQQVSCEEVQTCDSNIKAPLPLDFVNHDSIVKRSLFPVLESKVKMFSSERACGFAIETGAGGTVLPWLATIRCGGGVISCTGTLISSTLVLTSATCILSCGTNPVTVSLGDPAIFVVEFQAESAIVDPRFTTDNGGGGVVVGEDSPSSLPERSAFDVGLIRLHSPVDFNVYPFIYPICLVGVETDDPTIECEVVMSGGSHSQLQLLKSFVNCYQPGNEVCVGQGIMSTRACVHLTSNCFRVGDQTSVPVMCRRATTTGSSGLRYFLWGLTTATTSSSACFSGVVRVSDCFNFLITNDLGGNF